MPVNMLKKYPIRNLTITWIKVYLFHQNGKYTGNQDKRGLLSPY